MASGRFSAVGASVSVQLDAEGAATPILGNVIWQEERDGEFVVGCALKHMKDGETLHRLLGGVTDDSRSPCSARPIGQTFSLPTIWVLVFLGSTLLGLEAIETWRTSPTSGLRSVAGQRRTQIIESASDSPTTEIDSGPNQVDHAELDITDGRFSPSVSTMEEDAAQDTRVETTDSARLRNALNPDLAVKERGHVEETHVLPELSHDDLVPAWVEFILVNHSTFSIPSPEAKQENFAATTLVVSAQSPPLADQEGRSLDADIVKAKETFAQGCRLYRDGQFEKARKIVQTAIEYDTRNAFFHYVLAMAQYQLHHIEEATKTARLAMELEKHQPIDNWGIRLSRYQGRPRLWLEKLRAASQDPVND